MGKLVKEIVEQSVVFMEKIGEDDAEFEELYRRKEQFEAELEKQLDESLAVLFEEYVSVSADVEMKAVDAAYGEGICFGIQLMHEALD